MNVTLHLNGSASLFEDICYAKKAFAFLSNRTGSNHTTLAWIVSGILFYYSLSAIWNIYFHPLSKFPGPASTAISRLPLIHATIKGKVWQFNERLHAKYGPVVRVAPEELAITSLNAWNDIYLSKPLMPKDPFSQLPPMNGAHSLFTAAGETHRRLRKNFIHSFADRALKDQTDILQSHVDLFVQRVKREILKAKDRPIDLTKFYGYAALDIIADLTFGESFHGLEGDNEHGWILGFFLGAKFGSIRNSLSRFHPIDKVFGWFFLRLTARARARSWNIATENISQRLKMGDMGPSRSDLVTPLLARLDETQQKGISTKELTTNGLAMVIAGCQLSTVAWATATFLLLTHPSTLKLLAKEIQEHFKSQEHITPQSTKHLEYLNAVINETLRMHHPTPITLPRVSSDKGQLIDGQVIPARAVIGLNLQNIQNDPTYWVEPRTFHPERFLPSTDPRYDSKFDRDNKDAFHPFSIGERNCLGGKLFLAETRLILSKIIWHFDMVYDDPGRSTWLEQKAYLVFRPKPLWVRLKDKS